MKRLFALLLALLLPSSAFAAGTITYQGGVVAGVGNGDVIGPAVSVDNGLVRYDGTTGKLIQSYTSNTPTCGDTGICTFVTPILKGTTATDLPTYGSELLTSAGWTVNAGWTESPDDTFAHTGGGGTATLTHSATIANATKHQISWTVTGRTAGSFTVSVGGRTSDTQTATGSFGPTTTSTAAFTITPTTTFDGTISLTSLKQITAVSTAIASLLDSAGTTRLEIRAGTAADNTFIGLNSGRYNTTGYQNSAMGAQALTTNTTGYSNSAMGVNALQSNTTGYQNSAVGVSALQSNTTGYYNSAVGAQALYSNTTGYYNSAVGMTALFSNTTGYYNSAVGAQALYSNTTGYQNSAVGLNALFPNTTGYQNSALGHDAGRYITDGSTANQTSNTSLYLGTDTKSLASGDTNEIVIGYNAIGLGSNTVVLGNASIVTTALRGNVGIGTTSPSQKLDVNGALAITGTAGAGFFSLIGQASNPTAPAAGTLLIHSSTANGFTRMEQDNEATTNLIYGRDNVFIAKNTSGGTISKGQAVYVTGSTGNVPNIAKAQANSGTTLPVVAVVVDDILNNAFGQIMTVGIISMFDTSAFSVGAPVWLSSTVAGGFTATRPSGTTNFAQRVGSVLVSGVGNGSLMVNVAPAILNMETGTNAATWTGSAIVGSALTLNDTAPSLVLTDTTASAKSLTIAVDADLAQLRESAGASGSLITLDLANNNVGIGTNAPSGPGAFGANLKVMRTTDNWGVVIEGVGTNQSDMIFNTPNNTADNRIIQIRNSSDTFTIRSLTDAIAVKNTLFSANLTTGNVGIGTTSPASLLDLHAGDLTMSGANAQKYVLGHKTELTTIAAAATTATTITIPANAILKAVTMRVTTVIPTAATMVVTATTTGTVLQQGASIAVAAGTTDIGTRAWGTNYQGVAAQTITITPNATPVDNTGRVRFDIFFEEPTVPTS